MSEHARALAAQFRQMNATVIRFAQECAPDDWRRMVPHEGRSVAYLIDHIAWGYRTETKAIRAIVTGQEQPRAGDELPPSFTMEALHAMNATRWEADPYPDREETIARLRAEGKRTEAVVSGLSEADLERTIAYGPIPAMTIAQFIERFVIGHPGRHLPGIRQELAAPSRD
jgi:hypothetical protein